MRIYTTEISRGYILGLLVFLGDWFPNIHWHAIAHKAHTHILPQFFHTHSCVSDSGEMVPESPQFQSLTLTSLL